MISGDSKGQMFLFLNTGTKEEPVLAKGVPVEAEGKPIVGGRPRYEKDANGRYRRVENKRSLIGIYSKLHFADWDGDGRADLVCGTERPEVWFFRNKGSAATPELEEGRKLDLKGDGFENSYRCRIDIADWNNDGKLDVLAGNVYSNKRPSGGNVRLFLAK